MKRSFSFRRLASTHWATRNGLRCLAAVVAVGLGDAVTAGAESENAPAKGIASPPTPPETPSGWHFDLLPRAFQRNPRVDFNVISEMTEAGRRASPPSPEHPVFYELHLSETSDLRGDPDGGARPPDLAYLKRTLGDALAQNHLLPGALPEHAPTVLLVCHWGYYSVLESDPDFDAANRVRRRKELLDRAVLIGGEKFATELADVLERADRYGEAMAEFAHRSAAAGFPPILGDFTGGTDLLNPLEIFMSRDFKTRYLVEASAWPCYFVVVSAYDRPSALAHERRLLWRTKMTVDASGVSMRETLSPLIAGTSAFLGKDMTETATIERRIDRTGKVELGPLRVLGWESPGSDPSTATLNATRPPEKPEAEQPVPLDRK